MARTLAASSSAFCLVGHAQAGEVIARHAASIDPECAHGWSALAEALLAHKDRARLADAKRCARRAIELSLEDNDGLVTLHAVLKRRRKRRAGKELLARVSDVHADANERLTRRWTHMLIAMIANGGAPQVKQLLVDANATETLEPLWLAARAELRGLALSLRVPIAVSVKDNASRSSHDFLA